MNTLTRLGIGLLAVVVMGACAQEGGKAGETTTESTAGTTAETAPDMAVVTRGVEAAVIHDMLGEVAVSPGDTVYVSFGESWTDHVDPPEGFLERLDDASATLLPVSAYRPEHRGTPLLLVAHVTRREGDGEAWVKATRYRFGAGVAEGFTARVVRVEGEWEVKERTETWRT